MPHELLLIGVIAWVLAISCLVVWVFQTTPDSKPDNKPASQPEPQPTPSPKVSTYIKDLTKNPSGPVSSEDLLWLEYVPAEFLSAGKVFTATVGVQRALLAAGDTLLRKLQSHTRSYLNRPVDCSKIDLLAQGDDPQCLTPERVRAAIGVAEAALAIWAIMFECLVEAGTAPHWVAFDEAEGKIIAGQSKYSIHYVVSRISQGAGVTGAVAFQMWREIAEILRQGFVPIPGIKAKTEAGSPATAMG